MDITQLLAQIIGVYMLVAGISVLLRPERVKRAINDAAKSPIIPYFDGALAIVFGLIVVLTHNVWDGLQASVVTAIGWVSLIAGIFELLASQSGITKMFTWFNTAGGRTGMGVVAVLVGAYLTYAGFFAV